MEPAKGIEPLACGLRNRCSTAELRWPQSRARKPVHNPYYRQERALCKSVGFLLTMLDILDGKAIIVSNGLTQLEKTWTGYLQAYGCP